MIVIPYFVMWYSVTPAILREAGGFIHITLFIKTPVVVLIFAILLVSVYMTLRGEIEGIARCSEMMGPVICIMILVSLVLELNTANWHQLLPVYSDSGFVSIMKGAVHPFGFLGEAVMIMMIIPLMSVPQNSLI
ncbi:hypothetical protein GCM10025859_23240 [Alicyclobacillus fastidiosus]|nr:hypothetical protein GCM10025859_23240 [Alicyclobacillus fastidiosus]